MNWAKLAENSSFRAKSQSVTRNYLVNGTVDPPSLGGIRWPGPGSTAVQTPTRGSRLYRENYQEYRKNHRFRPLRLPLLHAGRLVAGRRDLNNLMS